MTFQSTRPRGARPEAVCGKLPSLVFQSTRPRGARPRYQPALRHLDLVSIHAPARGATGLIGMAGLALQVFQSTRPRGARPPTQGGQSNGLEVSIHAPARGATSSTVYRVAAFGFQSTRPRGARRSRKLRAKGWFVSIHAPARGATPSSSEDCRRSYCFNPRAREGRDPGQRSIELKLGMFQSTRPRGARPLNSVRMAAGQVFQSTRPRGARL